MNKLKLSYFNFDGIRGDSVRMALYVGNLEYEEERISFEEWPSLKPKFPFGGIPVLYVDGKTLAQTNSLLRYLGKLANLYPTDPWQAAQCDQAMDAIEEFTVLLTSSIPLPPEEKKTVRDKFAKETLPVFLTGLENILKETGAPYFGGSSISVADLRVFDVTRRLHAGVEYIPLGLAEQIAPLIAAHRDLVAAQPRVKAYCDLKKK